MTPPTRSDVALVRAFDAIGTPFRLHGRDLDGLDCVGLVGWAWRLIVPTGYPMHSAPAGLLARSADKLGLVGCQPHPGAIVLMAPGPGQLHLGIATGHEGIIHADAALRRVAIRIPAPWPLLAAWCKHGED